MLDPGGGVDGRGGEVGRGGQNRFELVSGCGNRFEGLGSGSADQRAEGEGHADGGVLMGEVKGQTDTWPRSICSKYGGLFLLIV